MAQLLSRLAARRCADVRTHAERLLAAADDRRTRRRPPTPASDLPREEGPQRS